MKKEAIEAISKIRNFGTKDATKEQLLKWVDVLADEIKMNESCNIRTDENETELRILYDCKCRCRQRLSLMGGEA